MAMHENDQKEQGKQPALKPASRNIMRLVICLLLIGAGIIGARFLIATKPKVNRRPPERMAPLVRTAVLQPENYTFSIPAMGTVIPSRETGLEVPVSGEVIYVHSEFTEGGMFAQGTKILQVDPKDYELAVQQKRRALADAEYSLKLEQGHQDVARQEWSLLYGDKVVNKGESDLALRKPHLEKVQAEIAAAKAELEQAEINLNRTTLTAPFNALVLKSYVELGSQVSSQKRLADLVGTDTYWVQVSLPVDRLRWVQVPNGDQGAGSEVDIFYRADNVKTGRVARLLPDLSKEGRMARLLIEVADPLDLQAKDEKQPMLLIGEFVRVSIEGEELHNVYRVPRSALRNDREVWIVDEESKLAIRPVKTIWRDQDTVVVQDGFKPGEALVISDIPAPVAGMDLRVELDGKREQQTDQQVQDSKLK
ncbi:MAG: efflux RND transporter periplasmic adaptor subunit [Desulfobacterales bacterium]|jgi:RND family efflux transporter MFP subunit|nr:efflux RND transporter periplasmic adaptor subunit [Desulfobacterales bacterium]